MLLCVGYMRSLNNTFILFLAFQRNLDAIWLTGPYINSSKEILIENLTGNLDSFGVLKALWVVCMCLGNWLEFNQHPSVCILLGIRRTTCMLLPNQISYGYKINSFHFN